ncbi:putative oxidoreductase [Friedmanniella endophytica]|uniref:Putative oxidoreductase n=1 Tax=Microlunatus kandeliicorticis TaxID=1759536 RepID=A0A7W3IQF5_9ACTN|nr:aldo/keto reductase [Microlunatus kandeliicorticis]MBA8793353.1 putative oxidoreductase [Microlunatus kandeliicorticis]
MKTQKLGTTDRTVSAVVVGMMRTAEMEDRAIDELVGTAREVGIDVFDHADIYGGEPHRAEQRWGEAVHLSPADREAIVIQSKVGIRSGFFDFSAEHILDSVDRSLAALRTDYLDVLLLHRPDALVEPEEVARAFDTLQQAGKVREFGVSNHTPGQIELLRTAVRQPLVANQVQVSITHAPIIASGVAANMQGLDQSVSRDNGLLDHARLNNITLQAWSPFQKGFFDGVFLGDPELPELNQALDEIAEAHGVTPTGIAVAWITRHPADIQVVLGTTNPGRVRESAAGSDVRLSRPEWYRLFTAAGYTLP